jgi:hypothetical protein
VASADKDALKGVLLPKDEETPAEEPEEVPAPSDASVPVLNSAIDANAQIMKLSQHILSLENQLKEYRTKEVEADVANMIACGQIPAALKDYTIHMGLASDDLSKKTFSDLKKTAPTKNLGKPVLASSLPASQTKPAINQQVRDEMLAAIKKK